jgi:hypothetical protein
MVPGDVLRNMEPSAMGLLNTSKDQGPNTGLLVGGERCSIDIPSAVVGFRKTLPSRMARYVHHQQQCEANFFHVLFS